MNGQSSGAARAGMSVGTDSGPSTGEVHRPYSQNLAQLQEEVSETCSTMDSRLTPDRLSALVTDLYLSNVDPADATEVLLRADCGSMDAVVAELVAQGGSGAFRSVYERARLLSGSGATATIEQALRQGLERHAAMLEQRSGPAHESLSYGMRYFPSDDSGYRTQTAVAMNLLLQQGIPGYGLYTFVLPGRGLLKANAGADPANQRRYDEFFRMIETYVATEGNGHPSVEKTSHVLVVPVYADYEEAPLREQVSPELSALMLRALMQYLHTHGQGMLANRLAQDPGPILVAALTPQLIPADPKSPVLVVDLSEIGPESFYGIIDAYDRAVPEREVGKSDSLRTISERLQRFVDEQGHLDVAVPKQPWIFWLGRGVPAHVKASAGAGQAKLQGI